MSSCWMISQRRAIPWKPANNSCLKQVHRVSKKSLLARLSDKKGTHMEHERFILGLMQLPGVGRKTAARAVARTTCIPSNLDEFYDKVFASGARPGLTRQEATDAWDHAGKVLEKAEELKIAAIAATRPNFPAWVK